MTPPLALLAHMADAGLDALVAVSLDNVFYSSGTLLLTQRIIPTRLAFVVWTAQGDRSMIVCSIELEQVARESSITDIRTYVEFLESPVQLLAELLRDKGLAAGRIGLETLSLASRYQAELAQALPRATFVDGDGVFELARMIKTPAEIDRLTRAAVATDVAIRTAFENATLGTSETEIAAGMQTRLMDGGADGLAFAVLTTGANSHLAHPLPSDTARVVPEDVVRTDFGGYFGAYFGGYFSDLARMAIGGSPTASQQTAYARLFEVHDLLLRSIRPGVRACDLFELCRRGMEERHLTFRSPHVGHNIGISVHEFPMLNPSTTQELLPGMVMAIEPIHFDPTGIFHIEDMIEVTADGCRTLSPAYTWSELLTIR